MHNTDGDKLAEDVMNAFGEFEMRFHGKGPFPMTYAKAFFETVARYVESTNDEAKINRNVASAVNGLREMLKVKSSRTPGKALPDTDWHACFLAGMPRILRVMSRPDFVFR